jgi:hypothetical protein
MRRLSHLALLFASLCQALFLACGGIAEGPEPMDMTPPRSDVGGDSYDCGQPGADPVACEGIDPTYYGTFEPGYLPPELRGAKESASTDKAYWTIFNGFKVYIPSLYGRFINGTCPACRCNTDQTTWPGDCRVPLDRTDVLCIDNTECESVSPQLGYAVADAVSDFFNYAHNDFGWDLSWVSCGSGQTLTVRCHGDEDGDDGTYGSHAQTTSACWDVPGKNVCFGSQGHSVNIDALEILQNWGSGPSGYFFTYNTTLHELGHAFGLGHQSGDALMKSSPTASWHNWQYSFDGTNVSVLTDFHRKAVPCNWQEGDPLGLACPHESQFP